VSGASVRTAGTPTGENSNQYALTQTAQRRDNQKKSWENLGGSAQTAAENINTPQPPRSPTRAGGEELCRRECSRVDSRIRRRGREKGNPSATDKGEVDQ
jgi:hypothetical protein